MKRMALTAALLLITAMLSGCINHTELDKIGIAEAVGVDYADGKYTVTVQYFNTDASGGVTAVDSSAPNVITVRGEGSTVENALQAVSYRSGHGLMLGAAAVIVFGEDAVSSLEEALDLAASHYSGNLRAYIAAAKGKASDIMDVKFTEGNASVEQLEELLANAEDIGLSRRIQLFEVMDKLCGPTRSVALPLLETSPDDSGVTEEGVNVVIAGGLVCSGGKAVCELDPEEMSALQMLDPFARGKGNCEMTLTFRGRDTRVMLYSVVPRITPEIRDGALDIDIRLTAGCKIISTSIPDPYAASDAVESICEEEAERRVRSLLDKTLSEGADVFGLDYTIRAASPALFKSLGSDYGSALSSSSRLVRASFRLERYGALARPTGADRA